MRNLRTEVTNLLQFAKASKFIVAGVAILAVGALAGWNVLFSQPHSAQAVAQQDCDSNAIVECGFLAGSRDSAVTGFLNDYKADKKKDLEEIYHAYGLSKSELPRFKDDAKLGHVTKDGKVVLDGKVVGQNARSLGRQSLSGSTKKTIDGKTYYERDTQDSFKTDSIPALILMNNGKVEFVVLSSCGNPVTVNPPKEDTPPASDYVCTGLTVTKKKTDDEKITQFDIKAKSGKTSGDFWGYYYNVYRLKDGKEDFVSGTYVEGDKALIYTQNTRGDYLAKARVVTLKNGKYVLSEFTNKCTVKFSVTSTPSTPEKPNTPPEQTVAECVKLVATLRPGTRGIYDYEVTTDVKGKAKVVEYTYDFGQEGTPPRTIKSNKTDFEYNKDGDHTTKVTVVFDVDGTQVAKSSPDCEAKTPMKPAEQPPATPNTPATPPAAEAPQGETPSTLPATGVQAALGGLMGTSALGGVTYYWRSSRRELISRLLGR